ncbi:peptidoglycan-binding domain-containing protein [Pacificoceanicola onchidii]|uniref:peptidoglycan-binding domain-containing protein n=1 Tax=Pacificoceanicola onchidii TaxID=2562685 RepID=UPI0010A5DE75|nr:peptidoglycan-binding domain-containing protein [Pacificoceanicola onchidii]
MSKKFVFAAMMAGIGFSPAPAAADDFIKGLAVGIIGGAIANQPKRRTTTVRRTTSSKPKYSAARAQNRETQTALNYFGFNAGSPDGVLGRKSRAAVTQYQVLMGYVASGQLTEFERNFLMTSYQRAQAGGATTATLIAQNPRGVQGLLLDYRDEQTGGVGARSALAGHYGLPPVIAQTVNEIAKSSDPTAEQLVNRHGFIQLADINGDGQTDYIIDTSVTGSAFWCSAQACTVRVFASTPEGYERNDFQAFNVTPAMFACTRGTCSKTNDGGTLMAAAPVPAPVPAPMPQQPQTQMAAVTVSTGGGTAPVPSAVPSVQAPQTAAVSGTAMPSFFGGGAAPERSLASHCNMVTLLTTTNGGYVTADTMTDPMAAMGEQMCFSRSYAMANGDVLVADLTGVTAEQISQQCAGFGTLLKDHVNAAALQPRVDVLRNVGQFVLGSGMAPAQLENTAMVCLSSGYKTDDMNAAVGSALVLVALGKAPYAELIGHHLSQGFGMPERADLSLAWYGQATEALDSGAKAVFGAGMPERVTLLKAAMGGLPGGAAPTAQPVQAGTAIPVFGSE